MFQNPVLNAASLHSSFDLPEFLSELVVGEAPGLHSECNSSHRNLYNDENCRLVMQIQEKYFNFKLIVSPSCKQIVHYCCFHAAQIRL